jgi:hypothetical protein
MLGLVALPADQMGMLALQRITGPVMIKSAHRRVPMDQREVRTIVLGVTPYAAPARPVRPYQRRMQSPVLLQAFADVTVTIETLELRVPD